MSPTIAIVNNGTERLARTATVLEALNALSREGVQQAYMEFALPLIFFRDESSFEMFGLILNNRIFDLGGIFGWGGLEGEVRNLISGRNPDVFTSRVEARLGRAEEAMDRDIEKLLELDQ